MSLKWPKSGSFVRSNNNILTTMAADTSLLSVSWRRSWFNIEPHSCLYMWGEKHLVVCTGARLANWQSRLFLVNLFACESSKILDYQTYHEHMTNDHAMDTIWAFQNHWNEHFEQKYSFIKMIWAVQVAFACALCTQLVKFIMLYLGMTPNDTLKWNTTKRKRFKGYQIIRLDANEYKNKALKWNSFFFFVSFVLFLFDLWKTKNWMKTTTTKTDCFIIIPRRVSCRNNRIWEWIQCRTQFCIKCRNSMHEIYTNVRYHHHYTVSGCVCTCARPTSRRANRQSKATLRTHITKFNTTKKKTHRMRHTRTH